MAKSSRAGEAERCEDGALREASGRRGGALAYDASIFGANAHAALGLCAFRLGRYAESAAHYARAEAIAPDNAAIRAKRLFAAAKAVSG